MLMFRRQHRRRTKSLLLVLGIPLAFMGAGYAYFIQDIGVVAQVQKPYYSSSQNIFMTYETNRLAQNGKYLYDLVVNVKNAGAMSTISWKLDFDLPSDTTAINCATVVSCSSAGSTVTVTNTPTNGSISAGGSTSFALSFTTSTPNYVLQNIYTSGVLNDFSLLSGLTTSLSQGSFTKNKNVYTWPVTFTVVNNHGSNVVAWRVIVPWDPSRQTVASMPSTVTYTTNASQLIISGKTGLTQGATVSFTAYLTSTVRKWVPTATVEGIN